MSMITAISLYLGIVYRLLIIIFLISYITAAFTTFSLLSPYAATFGTLANGAAAVTAFLNGVFVTGAAWLNKFLIVQGSVYLIFLTMAACATSTLSYLRKKKFHIIYSAVCLLCGWLTPIGGAISFCYCLFLVYFPEHANFRTANGLLRKFRFLKRMRLFMHNALFTRMYNACPRLVSKLRSWGFYPIFFFDFSLMITVTVGVYYLLKRKQRLNDKLESLSDFSAKSLLVLTSMSVKAGVIIAGVADLGGNLLPKNLYASSMVVDLFKLVASMLPDPKKPDEVNPLIAEAGGRAPRDVSGLGFEDDDDDVEGVIGALQKAKAGLKLIFQKYRTRLAVVVIGSIMGMLLYLFFNHPRVFSRFKDNLVNRYHEYFGVASTPDVGLVEGPVYGPEPKPEGFVCSPVFSEPKVPSSYEARKTDKGRGKNKSGRGWKKLNPGKDARRGSHSRRFKVKDSFFLYADDSIVEMYKNGEIVNKPQYINAKLKPGVYEIVRFDDDGRERTERIIVDETDWHKLNKNRYVDLKDDWLYKGLNDYYNKIEPLSRDSYHDLDLQNSLNYALLSDEECVDMPSPVRDTPVLECVDDHVKGSYIVCPDGRLLRFCDVTLCKREAAKLLEIERYWTLQEINQAMVGFADAAGPSKKCEACTSVVVELVEDVREILLNPTKYGLSEEYASKATKNQQKKLESMIPNSPITPTSHFKDAYVELLDEKDVHLSWGLCTSLGIIINEHSYKRLDKFKQDGQVTKATLALKQIRFEPKDTGHKDVLVLKRFDGLNYVTKKYFDLPQKGQKVYVYNPDTLSNGTITRIEEEEEGLNVYVAASTIKGHCGSSYVNTNGKVVGFHFRQGTPDKDNAGAAITERFMTLFDNQGSKNR